MPMIGMPILMRVIHDLGDFARMHQAERTAGHGEILRVDADRAAAEWCRSR